MPPLALEVRPIPVTITVVSFDPVEHLNKDRGCLVPQCPFVDGGVRLNRGDLDRSEATRSRIAEPLPSSDLSHSAEQMRDDDLQRKGFRWWRCWG